MSLLRVQGEQPNLQPDIIFSIGDFGITNVFLMTWLIIGIIVYFIVQSRKFSLKPTKLQTVLEVVYEMIFGLVEQLAGSKKIAKKAFPLVGFAFVLIFFSNFISLPNK